jgi:hypothetical protein
MAAKAPGTAYSSVFKSLSVSTLYWGQQAKSITYAYDYLVVGGVGGVGGRGGDGFGWEVILWRDTHSITMQYTSVSQYNSTLQGRG